MSKSTITSVGWKSEEDFFAAKRRDPKLEIIEKKWSEGSSPILLVKWGYIEKEEWEECFWFHHPSSTRCFECPHAKVCPQFVS